MEEKPDFKKKITTYLSDLKKTFGNYGCAGALIRICLYLLKVFIALLFGGESWKRLSKRSEDRSFRREYENSEDTKILQKWEEAWRQRNPEEMPLNSYFYSLFEDNYRMAFLKSKKNKKKNFVWKFVFLLVLFGSLLCCAFLFYYSYIQKDEGFLKSMISSGILFVFVILACGLVSKWLDVKKYQETWVRHTYSLQRLNYEMLLYIYGMKYYGQWNRDEVFKRRVFDIWMNNLEKFKTNMEQKEKEMMDIFSNVRMNAGKK